MNRRTFLKAAGGGLSTLAVGKDGVLGAASSAQASPRSALVSDVVVVGAGAFGGWTALYLREMGASVTMVDDLFTPKSRCVL